MSARKFTTQERLLQKISVQDRGYVSPCWIWTASTFLTTGYAQFMTCSNGKRKNRTGHSVAYELYVGLVPDGYEIDHLCRIRHCVNPKHLEAVVQRVNWDRGQSPPAVSSKSTHCPRGHEFTPENTIRLPKGLTKAGTFRTRRKCRQCDLDRQRAGYYKRRLPGAARIG